MSQEKGAHERHTVPAPIGPVPAAGPAIEAFSAGGMTQDEIMRNVVPKMTQTIIEIAHPVRVILFGSAARGEMGPDSDLDVLVVVPDGTHRRRTCEKLYLGLRGLEVAKDILVATESDLAAHGSKPWWVYHDALAEGKELYHAEA